jgi:hypothetical protein
MIKNAAEERWHLRFLLVPRRTTDDPKVHDRRWLEWVLRRRTETHERGWIWQYCPIDRALALADRLEATARGSSSTWAFAAREEAEQLRLLGGTK